MKKNIIYLIEFVVFTPFLILQIWNFCSIISFWCGKQYGRHGSRSGRSSMAFVEFGLLVLYVCMLMGVRSGLEKGVVSNPSDIKQGWFLMPWGMGLLGIILIISSRMLAWFVVLCVKIAKRRSNRGG